jgi:hypothetical protein
VQRSRRSRRLTITRDGSGPTTASSPDWAALRLASGAEERPAVQL